MAVRRSLPERVEESAVDLPASMQLFEIEGAIPLQFWRLRAQPGDGMPTSDHQTAQHQIVEATITTLPRA